MKHLIYTIALLFIFAACKVPVKPGTAVGYFDGISNGVAAGWAYTKGSQDESIAVQFFADGDYTNGSVLGTGLANKPRQDVNDSLNIRGDHGFQFTLPESVRDGALHQIHAYGVGTDGLYEIENSPQPFQSVIPCRTAGPLVPAVADEFEVQFEAANGKYFSAECGGDDTGRVTANADAAGEWETFYVSRKDGKYAIRSSHGRYLSAENGGGAEVHANRTSVGAWELFQLEGTLSNGMTVAFKASNNQHYVTANLGTAPFVVSAEGPANGPWEKIKLHMQSGPHVDPMSFSLAKIRDMQGDLMLWVPELKPNYVNGVDTRSGIREHADNGGTPRGLAAGWIWSITIDRYQKEDREKIYQAALNRGYTHFAIQVTQCEPNNEGYHGLMHTSPEDCVGHGDKLNMLLQEIWDHRLIPLCTGVSPTDRAQDGLDRSLCRIVLNDWDNSGEADCHIKALADTFPNAQIVYEIPEGDKKPIPDACSPNPFPSTGGGWIRQAQQRWPNFFAIAYEVSVVNGIETNVAQYNEYHSYFRDLQEIQFETDTYWKFWDNLSDNDQRAYNDEVKRRVPFLKGYMSGSSSHAPPSDETSHGDFVGELDPHNGTAHHMAPGFADWPETTQIVRLELTLNEVRVQLNNGRPDSWPNTPERPDMGELLYSMGIAELINGQWHYSAPIQLWRGLEGSGGAIQEQDVGDGSGRGQIRANWFYSNAWWGIMSTYDPKPGEVIGFFICAGDCRDGDPSHSPVKERSNIVLFPLPAPGTTGVFQR